MVGEQRYQHGDIVEVPWCGEERLSARVLGVYGPAVARHVYVQLIFSDDDYHDDYFEPPEPWRISYPIDEVRPLKAA